MKPLNFILGRTAYEITQAYYLIMLVSVSIVVIVTLRMKMYFFFIGHFLKKSMFLVFLVLIIFNVVSREVHTATAQSEFTTYTIMWLCIGVGLRFIYNLMVIQDQELLMSIDNPKLTNIELL